MRTLRWIGLVGVLVVVLAAATGTATGKQAGSTGPQASARASLPPYVVLAKKKVAEYSALDKMKFSFPTDSYDPGSKNVAIITGGNGVPVLVENAKYVQDAFNAMGWKAPTIYDGKFAPATQAQLVDQAIQRGDDAIVLLALDVQAIKTSVENALAKNIAVGCVVCVSGDEWHKKGVMDVSVDFKTQGEMAAWFTIAHSNGKAKAIDFIEPAYGSTLAKIGGFESIFKLCKTCKLVKKGVIIPAGTLGSPGPPGFTALLTSQRKGAFNYAVSYSDALGIPMAKTLKQTGRTDVKIVGFDAQPEATTLTKSDPNYVVTVAIPYEYADWATADNVARKVAGKPTYADKSLPSVLITKANVAGYTPYAGPAGDWKGRFKKLWGKG